MEPGQSEAKRPRLLNGNHPSWNGPVLPPPQPSQQHHPPSLPPYQPHSLYHRQHQEHPPHPGHHHPDDRRHHEQDSYPPPAPPPLQDHRPPPSPAHAPFQPYRRESMVKRESGDDTSLPQMRRPNSTGTAPDTVPPHPHGLPPYSGPHIDDHRRPPSFDNGGSIPQSPQVYRQPQPPYHPPPTPIAQHNQYEAPPPGYGPPQSASEMYSNLPIASAKRKAQRASQACDMCRQLKAKCDEQRPCKNCKDKSTPCVYRDLPTKQPDKVSADILDLMSALKDQIASEFSRMDHRMSRLESTLRASDQSSEMKVESVEDDQQEYDSLPAADSKDPIDEQASSPRNSNDSEKHDVKSAVETVRNMDNDEIEKDPGPPVNPGQPSLPANHTTLAALLLKWPSVDNLVRDLLEKESIRHIDEFPVSQEQQRGVLRVWGKGEGYLFGNKHESKGHQVITDINDSPDAPSPFSDREAWTDALAWGQVGIGTSQSVDIYKGGVLLVDGNPDFDRTTVQHYVQSFKENVLNMHPILIPRQLDALVTIFLDSLPQGTSKASNKSGAKFVQTGGPSIPPLGPETGSKRKRSPAVEEQGSSVTFQRPGLPVRSIHSALVLAVLALGKICLHKGKIPDLVQDQDPLPYSSPSVRTGALSSPSQGSPPGHASAQASGLPSPKEIDRSMSSRRPSLQGTSPAFKGQNIKRNFDVVPGLEYFGLAADIFGSHIGGFTLKHVYVALFLGLYHGQLGRVIESWSYIALAGRTLQVVLRPSLSRLSSFRTEGQVPQIPRDNQLAFAYWTCLQLESDILAELPMPHSGILSYEEVMPYPNLSAQSNSGYESYILSSYQAQLWVRRQLNKVHNELYSLESPDARETMEEKTNQLQKMLDKSEWVPPEFQFSDSEAPAKDILTARLRAKYWGSQVILYRKYIDMILNNQRMPEHTFREAPPHPSEWAKHKINLQVCPPGIDPRALNYARLGISALIESTRAFHGLERGNRILVTNVFTTAHAQWGNLLVLSACYRHQVLRYFIPGDLLQELFLRTIDFFKLIAHSTSPLKIDMNILTGLYKKLGFPLVEYDGGANSSFSSLTSTGHAPGHTPSDNYHSGTPIMPPPSHGVS